MVGSTREYDMRCERIVSEFLDKYFYRNVSGKAQPL